MISELYDSRFGDTFVIDFDVPSGEVHQITRYVDQIGRDPITYDTLAECPNRVQDRIQHIIDKACQPTPPANAS